MAHINQQRKLVEKNQEKWYNNTKGYRIPNN